MNRMLSRRLAGAALCAALLGTALPAWAQDAFKIGLILPMTGPSQSTGKQINAAVKLFMQQNGDMVAGRKVELILRDDAGVADTTRRVAQELVVKDKVNVLAGFGLTPLALSVAPIATQAKVPMVVMAAATSVITEKSPFIVRSSQTLPQVSGTMGTWSAGQGIKKVVTLVADYGPGLDAETWFNKQFKAAGGEILDNLRVPLANPDFAPFLQRVRDAKPDAVFVFTPSGFGAVFIKQFIERGLDKSGIKLIGTGDVTDDDQLNDMGDVTLGVVTAGPYSASHASEANKKFVSTFKAANAGMRPNFMAVFGYDGMQMIYDAVKKTGGKGDGTALVAAMEGASWESPRGPVKIDPATRDIVQDVYIRKVVRADGELYNEEFATVKQVADPAHGSTP
jgi:branched-chain amino acid transport system substrate-binding protein